MILTFRIIISILTIILVTTATAGTTYAFFTSTQTFAGNVISTGSLSFVSVLTDTNSNLVNSIAEDNFAPGITTTRCLFVKNSGTLPGRFKVYRKSHTGDISGLGNALTLSGALNPSSGLCSSLHPIGFDQGSLHSMNQVSHTLAIGDSQFGSLSTTPFKVSKNDAPIPPNKYVVYRFEISLNPATTSGNNSSYSTEFEVFGIQSDGSDVGSDW